MPDGLIPGGELINSELYRRFKEFPAQVRSFKQPQAGSATMSPSLLLAQKYCMMVY